jgi:hypothetical protein
MMHKIERDWKGIQVLWSEMTRRSKICSFMLLGWSVLGANGFYGEMSATRRHRLSLTTQLHAKNTHSERRSRATICRRAWFSGGTKAAAIAFTSLLEQVFVPMPAANADEESDFFDDPEIKEMYENPSIPKAPEERSGLVVLRVAEVAQFQEKILRSIASGELTGVVVSPMQFSFGTQILLRNSNLDGNMRLMIQEEIPRNRQKDAAKSAAHAMNQLQEIAKFSASIQRDFETIEMVQLADMYRNVRIDLNQLYDYLPEKDKGRYYGYFVAVTAYEKKIAEGTYNPDLDGILQFDK